MVLPTSPFSLLLLICLIVVAGGCDDPEVSEPIDRSTPTVEAMPDQSDEQAVREAFDRAFAAADVEALQDLLDDHDESAALAAKQIMRAAVESRQITAFQAAVKAQLGEPGLAVLAGDVVYLTPPWQPEANGSSLPLIRRGSAWFVDSSQIQRDAGDRLTPDPMRGQLISALYDSDLLDAADTPLALEQARTRALYELPAASAVE